MENNNQQATSIDNKPTQASISRERLAEMPEHERLNLILKLKQQSINNDSSNTAPSTVNSDEGNDENNVEESENAPQEEEPQTSHQPTYKVKVDNEEIEVTLDELLAGYSRTADYTRKTQAVAEERKKLNQALAQVNQVAEVAIQYMLTADPELNQFNQIDWDQLYKTNPVEYAAKWNRYQQKVAQLQQLQQIRSAYQQQMLDELKMKNAQLLPKMIPEWNDVTVAEKEAQKLNQYLSKTGFTKEELAGLIDARQISIARKAMLYDEMMNAKKSLNQKTTAEQKIPPKTAQKTITNEETKLKQMISTENNMLKKAQLIAQLKQLQQKKGA